MQPSTHEVTQLLRAWSVGDQEALDRLVPLVYDELYRTAHRYMSREQTGHTLQTTALVNEVYVRLVDSRETNWQDRAHFFAVAARLMRHVLVDYARSRRSRKRGGDWRHVTFDEAHAPLLKPRVDLVALDEALNALKSIDKRKSDVVELRYFGGLNVEQTAEVLKVSPETVKRDWRLAKVWLLKQISGERS